MTVEKFGSEGRKRGDDVRLSKQSIKGFFSLFQGGEDFGLWRRENGSREGRVTGLREGTRTLSRD